MKKVALIAISLIAIGALIYIVPRIKATRSAQPLQGIFDVQMKCMGGHEMFLELSGGSASTTAQGTANGRSERESSVMQLLRPSSTHATISHGFGLSGMDRRIHLSS